MSDVRIETPGVQGAAGVTWRGNWATATAYKTRHTVYHRGSSWRALVDHTSGASTEPEIGASTAATWAVVAFRGKSSYEIAVQYGYEGTEAEWIAENEELRLAMEQLKADVEEATAVAVAAAEAAEEAAAEAAAAAENAVSRAWPLKPGVIREWRSKLTNRLFMRLVWDSLLRVIRLEGHARTEDAGMPWPLPPGTMQETRAPGNFVAFRTVFDHLLKGFRVENHARTEDAGMPWPTRPGAGREVRSRDNQVLSRANWDHYARALISEGHASTMDLGMPWPLPPGTADARRTRDNRSLTRTVYDHLLRALRIAGHAREEDIGMPWPSAPGTVLEIRAGPLRGLVARWVFNHDRNRPQLEGVVYEDDLPNTLPALTAPGDMVFVRPGDVRAFEVPITSRSPEAGYGWRQLPALPTPYVMSRGIGSGVTIKVRRSHRMLIAGRQYIGAYDPGAVLSKVDKGPFVDSGTLGSAAALADGDYKECAATAGVTIGSDTFAQGDLAVADGGAWVKQARPAGSSNRRAFWQASAGGTFKGIELAAGDRIVLAGFRSTSGTGRFEWFKGDPARGHFFVYGETATPSSSPPVSPTPVVNALYQVTADDGPFAVDDWLVYRAASWGQIRTTVVTSVNNGGYLWFGDIDDASAFEWQRSDRSTTQVTLDLLGLTETRISKTRTSSVFMFGDSMPGYLASSLAAALTDLGVGFSFDSMGGAGADHIESMLEHLLFTQGGALDDRIVAHWGDQNTAGDFAQNREARSLVAALAGARDARLVLMSMLGQAVFSYADGRFKCLNWENQFFKNTGSNIYRSLLHNKQTFPSFCFDTRAEMATAADSTPHLLFPGMTEAEVAEAYGHVPLSYLMDYDELGIVPAALNYLGVHSAAGLPTGGSDNDYYIRSVADGSVPVGALLIKLGGVWASYYLDDNTHLRLAKANAHLANRFVLFVQAKGWF